MHSVVDPYPSTTMATARRKSIFKSPELALAFKLATANRQRLFVTLAGASLAVSLIICQFFLIVGFISAGQ